MREEWGNSLIRSWSEHGWIELPRILGDKIARLVGATSGEVIVCDSTSINLFKSLTAALSINSDRKIILSDCSNFPTDLYIINGVISSLGRDVELRLVQPHEIEMSLDARVAVVMLSHVNYRNGAMYDMTKVTRSVHDVGALMIWDLAHSAGAMPIELDACGVDFAVGCGYKFLNGGPGAPAFIFVSEQLQTIVQTPLSGWMGHESPFLFSEHYQPASGIERLLCGTPAILSMVALEVGVDLLLNIDLKLIREKSLRLANYFMSLIDERCPKFGFTIVTPRESGCRGSQVSISHVESDQIMRALYKQGVIGDYRPPDILRFGLAPLYTRYIDIWDAVENLRIVMDSITE